MHAHAQRRHQSGVMLLEVLIAILIFSVGILGVVGLQATAISQVTDAKYRTDAALLANQLIGQMVAANISPADLQDRFQTGSTKDYKTWVGTVAATLPGVSSKTGDSTNPTVAISNAGVITITIRWRQPSDTANADPHSYVTLAQINIGG